MGRVKNARVDFLALAILTVALHSKQWAVPANRAQSRKHGDPSKPPVVASARTFCAVLRVDASCCGCDRNETPWRTRSRRGGRECVLLPADEGVGHGAGDRAAEIGVLSQSGVSSSVCLRRFVVNPEGGGGGGGCKNADNTSFLFCLNSPSLPPPSDTRCKHACMHTYIHAHGHARMAIFAGCG